MASAEHREKHQTYLDPGLLIEGCRVTTAVEQIFNTSKLIDSMLAAGLDSRGIVSQTVSGHLRNLVEAVIVACGNHPDHYMDYQYVSPAREQIDGKGEYRSLIKFHDLLQISFSHYTLDADSSERLMLKYVEYLITLRKLCKDKFGFQILQELEKFPLDLDPALTEYHATIAVQIETMRANYTKSSAPTQRYYIDRVRPFFVDWKVYYEITFRNATDYTTKHDRLIAFTDIDINAHYSCLLWLRSSTINVVGKDLPVTIIENYSVSIRPAELTHLAQIVDEDAREISSSSVEYQNLSIYLTHTGLNLLDVILLSNYRFKEFSDEIKSRAKADYISSILSQSRNLVRSGHQGHHVLRYLLFMMDNQIIKEQRAFAGQNQMRGELTVTSKSYSFEKMPFALSLHRHNPRMVDLLRCIPTEGREHELLSRRVRQTVEQEGSIYIPVERMASEGLDRKAAQAQLEPLARKFNRNLIPSQSSREIILDKGQIFVREYEDTVSAIIRKLRELQSPVEGYRARAVQWLAAPETEAGVNSIKLDDTKKVEILPQMFENSKVAILFGAAGTGKSTMVDIVSQLHSTERKLFLAHTNPAVDNLKRRVSGDDWNNEFRTIRKHMHSSDSSYYDLLVVDECSTVDNNSFLEVLRKTKFGKLLLVGDTYQIESIEFGNWFNISREYMKETSVFELTTPFRSTNPVLLKLWDQVRKMEDDIDERLTKGGYSKPLDSGFFASIGEGQRDEITLCLNYDGLYGINNINRFMQSVNPGKAVTWNSGTYKVGDPVLFSDSMRFRGLIFNNLKGKIIDFGTHDSYITFDIELDRPEEDIAAYRIPDAEHLSGSVVRFTVTRLKSTDEDESDPRNSVPFQVAYAVSIHKAQGLEYESVRLVITADNEDRVTHNIFYTAITRARRNLTIYWSPEAQRRIVSSFSKSDDRRTLKLLALRGKI